MTRSAVLTQYRPIRAGIQRVLRLAANACKGADLTRAVKQVAPWAEELSDEEAADMIVDVALFEPNQRGRRAFERFLAEKGEQLEPVDRALAQSMTRAFFSMFRVAERHEAAGLWLEDLLDENRRLWLVDKGLEASAPEGDVLGMRLFDAGPFHAGFGIIVAPDEDTIAFCVEAKARGRPLPVRHSLAATLYGGRLRAHAPAGPADLALLQTVLEFLSTTPTTPQEIAPPKVSSRPPHPGSRSHPRKR